MSEALAAEVAPFGIRVLVVEPGLFRTDFLSADKLVSFDMSEPYRGSFADQGSQKYKMAHGKQPGDPAKAARAILAEVFDPVLIDGKPSLRLPLGPDAYARVEFKVKTLQDTLHGLEERIAATNFGA